ncbi:type III secretion system chaperone [Photorhabdus stackebrandtii]|uniref:Type III secretion protein n=1 Tax=Photorhabdus stackebrandtii TaxID=1123042 RepID=A0A7X5TL42_9GAMM|nr:type III secretion system chaperone [Photorhabdus stackebrandtii]NHB96019.1 type III secretion protein [Photorhabdus stackebrandtii]
MNDYLTDILLTELAAKLGMSKLSFDKEGNCFLLVDNAIPIILRHQEEHLAIIGQINMELPDSADADTLRYLLNTALNPLNSQMPGIGWHQELGVVAYRILTIQHLTANKLEDKLSEFITWINEFPTSLSQKNTLQSSYDRRMIYDRV